MYNKLNITSRSVSYHKRLFDLDTSKKKSDLFAQNPILCCVFPLLGKDSFTKLQNDDNGPYCSKFEYLENSKHLVKYFTKKFRNKKDISYGVVRQITKTLMSLPGLQVFQTK